MVPRDDESCESDGQVGSARSGMPRCQRRTCITAPTGPRGATVTESPGLEYEGVRNETWMNEVVDKR